MMRIRNRDYGTLVGFPSRVVEFDGHPVSGDGTECGIGDHLERRDGIDGVIEVGDGPVSG